MTMRILFTRFPLESAWGGAEVQTMSLMRGLVAKRHAVAFLGSCPTLLEKCREEGIPSAELTIGPPPVTKWGALSFVWRKQGMRTLLEAALDQFQHLDCICMLSLSEKLLLTPIALEKGIPVVWIEHDRVGHWLSKNPWLPQLRERSKNVTTVVVSDVSKKIYRQLGWNPHTVIAVANGIDLERFANPSPLTRREEVHFPLHIGTVARLTEDKGVDLLIEAVADLPSVTLTIIGQGREEGYLRKLADAANARASSEKIAMHPSAPDLGGFYSGLDLFVLPSREHDPFGLAAAEAMSMGVPVIVTDACGIAGYLTHNQDALIVPANDAHALQNAVAQLHDPLMRRAMGEAGLHTARQQFALHSMIEKYEKIFLEIRAH